MPTTGVTKKRLGKHIPWREAKSHYRFIKNVFPSGGAGGGKLSRKHEGRSFQTEPRQGLQNGEARKHYYSSLVRQESRCKHKEIQSDEDGDTQSESETPKETNAVETQRGGKPSVDRTV